MLVILEGPDGVGKSTLADGLEPDILYHAAQPTSFDPYSEYLPPSLLETRSHETVVCDRWHWGEEIYGPLYRGESLLGGMLSLERYYIDLALSQLGAVVVLLTAPEALLHERHAARGEDFLKSEDVARVQRAYRSMEATSFVYPTVEAPHDITPAQIKALAIENRPHRAARHDWIGPCEPELVVVTECGASLRPDRVTNAHNLALLRAGQVSRIKRLAFVDVAHGYDLSAITCPVIAYGHKARSALRSDGVSFYPGMERSDPFPLAEEFHDALIT